MSEPLPSKVKLFLMLCIAGLAVLAGAVYWAKMRASREPVAFTLPTEIPVSSAPEPPVQAVVSGTEEASAESSVAVLPPRPESAQPSTSVAPARVFFRYTGLDVHYGKLAFRDGPRGVLQFAEPLSCEVAYVGGAHGICLVAKRGVFTTYSGKLFDAGTFATIADFPLQGVPSRNRVSVDGKLAAYTVFLTGHGYSSVDFSTQTVILDVPSARVVADLETDFTVRRDGQVIKEEDFNFWGVTFTPDAKGFFATLSTGGKHFLVSGDIATRTMQVIHDNVECPSLSPDGTRVAYKKRFIIDNRIVWQLHVLDVMTGKETSLSEQRSIDDQLEWLDNRNVLYSVPEGDGSSGGGTDVWVVPADGKGQPRLYLTKSYSPSVVR